MVGTGEGRGVAVVAGATGYLGRHVVQALHRDGWRVRALARDPARLQDVREQCHEIVVAEATRPETLTGLFDGADAAFSSIGVRHFRRRPTFEEVDYQANLNLVEAAEAAGTSRFVFVSVFGGDRYRTRSPLVDARERVVDRLRSSGMRGVVLRPTGFFNDMGEILGMARKGKVWMIGSGETRINPIHGKDLADVVAGAMGDPDPAPDISAGGPEVFSQQEIAALAFQVLNRPIRTGRVSPGMVRGVARLIRPFNPNASALAMMFAMLGEADAVAPRFGTHRLIDYFRSL